MATALKGLAITSTDLVDRGANPDAHIRLFKSEDGVNGATSKEKEEEQFQATQGILKGEVEGLQSQNKEYVAKVLLWNKRWKP